ncbi:hypothetical protein VKT23_018936 [Stygiomarasmius scandens]|uniref:Uncharacterized protein n=1 Tax=Marasmiellus scandens TaxID=2682957 RepID=A0ABR1IPH4_9AGAR
MMSRTATLTLTSARIGSEPESHTSVTARVSCTARKRHRNTISSPLVFTPATVPTVTPTSVHFSSKSKSKSSPAISTGRCRITYDSNSTKRVPKSFFTSSPMRSDSEDDSVTSWSERSTMRRSLSPPTYSSNYASTSANTLNSYPHGIESSKAIKTTSFRQKVFELASGKTIVSRSREKLISTKPGEKGAGETETEVDEPPRHLPTTRTSIPHPSSSDPSQRRHIDPLFLLFEFSRLLSIVPALIGLLWNIWCWWTWEADQGYGWYGGPGVGGGGGEAEIGYGGGRRLPPDRMDYFVSALWTLLTGYQCLSLTTGLLTRWRLYYPPLATLIRLLALQAICWPATYYTLVILDVGTRPVGTWAVVGTTTCMSRSVQIWVTSNLWWEGGGGGGGGDDSSSSGGSGVNGATANGGPSSSSSPNHNHKSPSSNSKHRPGMRTFRTGADWYRFKGGQWGGRRWDWDEVVWKCALPAGVVYTVMTWAAEGRREFGAGC